MPRDPKHTKPLSRLEALPNDMLLEIMTRVGANAVDDLKHCMLTCPELKDAVDDPQVYRNINLSHVVSNPRLANSTYSKLVTKCLRHNNPSAHYVKGILAYFIADISGRGLRHLKIAADAALPEAIYLYGIIKLCMGEFLEGGRYMEQLNWRVDQKKSEACWANIRASLRGIWVIRKPIYYKTVLTSMAHTRACTQLVSGTICPECYYNKLIIKFTFNF